MSDLVVVDKGSNVSIGQCQAAANTAEAAAQLAAESAQTILEATTAATLAAAGAKVSETNAALSKESAEAAETAAITAAAQAANFAAGLIGTSTTSQVIEKASKTFTTQASKQFNPGQYVIISDADNPTLYWMYGIVTSYSGTTLVVSVGAINGAGYTKAKWNISVSGAIGTAPTLSIGTITTLSAGSQATATLSGTAESPVLNLAIPKGDKGEENYTNIDGGTPSSNYGGIPPIDLGGVV